MDKEIYLILTQTDSFPSRMIKVYTRAEYNHISIALSSDLKPMFSFGRRKPHNPWIGGFVMEHLREGIYKRFPNTIASVLAISVPEKIHESISSLLYEMYETKEEFGYDYVGLALAAIRIRKTSDKKYYCSEFIKTVFEKYQVPGSDAIGRIAAPSDFLEYPNARLVFRGLLREYCPSEEAFYVHC